MDGVEITREGDAVVIRVPGGLTADHRAQIEAAIERAEKDLLRRIIRGLRDDDE